MLNELRLLLAKAITAYDNAQDKKSLSVLDRAIYMMYLDANSLDNILDVDVIKDASAYDSIPELRFKAIECMITGERIDGSINVFMPNPFVPSSCSFVNAYGRLYMVWQGALVEALAKLESRYGTLTYDFIISSLPDTPIIAHHDVYDLISDFTYA